MDDFFASVLSLAFIAQVLRITVPYALAALGGVMSERSGVVNIALEGILLVGAFTCTIAASRIDLVAGTQADSIAAGVLFGALGGVLVAALYALVVIRLQADQIVAGVAINLLAYGLTRYLLKLIFGSTSNSPPIPGFGRNILENPVFWLIVVIAFLVYVLVTRTRAGLRLRAVGDHPEAADTMGVHVNRVRWLALLAAGALAGLGGAWMALSSRGPGRPGRRVDGSQHQQLRRRDVGRPRLHRAGCRHHGQLAPAVGSRRLLALRFCRGDPAPARGVQHRGHSQRAHQDPALRPHHGGAGRVHRSLTAAGRAGQTVSVGLTNRHSLSERSVNRG
jgi:ABC-type uncharacterized transport system permease subunit